MHWLIGESLIVWWPSVKTVITVIESDGHNYWWLFFMAISLCGCPRPLPFLLIPLSPAALPLAHSHSAKRKTATNSNVATPPLFNSSKNITKGIHFHSSSYSSIIFSSCKVFLTFSNDIISYIQHSLFSLLSILLTQPKLSYFNFIYKYNTNVLNFS